MQTPNPTATMTSNSPYAGHTPGPFEAWRHPTRPNCYIVFKLMGRDRDEIATVHAAGYTGDAETKANAELIAAAPMLLQEVESLQATNAALRAALASLLPLAIHTSPEDVAVHHARAALAKGVQS
jgi:hypothetical protein